MGVAFCAASLQSANLKLSENQKSKVTEAFAVALFPLQWLLFKPPLDLEKRFKCNTAKIFGEHSKAWRRTTMVTPKHALGGKRLAFCWFYFCFVFS